MSIIRTHAPTYQKTQNNTHEQINVSKRSENWEHFLNPFPSLLYQNEYHKAEILCRRTYLFFYKTLELPPLTENNQRFYKRETLKSILEKVLQFWQNEASIEKINSSNGILKLCQPSIIYKFLCIIKAREVMTWLNNLELAPGVFEGQIVITD